MDTGGFAIMKSMLLQADEIIHGERVVLYGPASETFEFVADAFFALTEKHITARDIALIQVLLKLKRNQHSSQNPDHILDSLGYMGIMADIQFGGPNE